MDGYGGMRRRVFVEDARGNGQFLRVTWHAEQDQFVVSNWEDTVCVGATRVPVTAVPDLVAVLVEGLADAASRPAGEGAAEARSLREHLRAWWAGRAHRAPVVPLRQPGEGVRRSA